MRWLAALVCVGCGTLRDPPFPDEPAIPAPLDVYALWRDAPSGRQTVDAVVSSGRTVGGLAFYAQDAEGGPQSGLRVNLGAAVSPWPPAIGTPVRLTGEVRLVDGAPTLRLDARDDLVVLGPPVPLGEVPFSDDPVLAGARVVARGLTLTSNPDPTGLVPTTGPWLDGALGVALPGYGSQLDARGIWRAADLLAPTEPADLAGDWLPPSWPDAPLTALRDGGVPCGEPVRVLGVQATPWSLDGRYVVLHDADGVGVWLDAEAFGPSPTQPGDAVEARGELRCDGEGLRLRAWEPLIALGPGASAPSSGRDDGDVVTLQLESLGALDENGDRRAGAFTLDARFAPIDALVAPVTVRVALRADTPRTRACVLD